MEKFYASLKNLQPVQTAALVLVLLASGGATYAGYELSSRGSSSGLGEDQQLIPIGFGDLVRQVTTSGSLEFPNRNSMSFGTAGTVDRLMVREGESVTAGQELARLDTATAASLAQSAAQAQVDVIAAQEALDELLDPTALSLAQAGRNIASAEFDLQTAEKALDDLLNSAALSLAQALHKVASAEFDLQAAKEALDEANIPFSREEIKTQEQSVASARLQVQEAEETLRLLGRSYSQSFAQALLDKADADKGSVDAKIALEAYETANAVKLEQNRVDQVLARKIYDDTVLELESLLDSQAAGAQGLEGPILQLQGLLLDRKERLDSANAELVVLEQLIAEKDKAESDLAEATAALADLGAGGVTPPVESQLAEIEDARANLESVQASGLDATVAEAKLAALRLGLSAIESGADPVKVSLLEADVVQAWAKLGDEELDLADMVAGPDGVVVALRSREIDVAAASLEQASQDLQDLLSLGAEGLSAQESGRLSVSEGNYYDIIAVPNAVEVALRSNEIDVAVASLEQASQDLVDLLSPNPADRALLESKLTAAQTAHAIALEKLETVSIKAPFVGFISVVSVSVGDQVSANAEIVEVVDPSVVEMDGIVDEIDILLLSEGLIASVTVDALPGQVLSGVVSEIAPAATNQQGVVTYSLRVRVQIPENVRLRDGLSAVADLILEQQLNVLLVPQQAIFGTFQAPTVKLQTESGIVEQPVVLGNSDDFWTEVRGGLQEGDRVVMQSSQTATDRFGAFRQFRGIGGGGGGGVIIRGR